MSSTTDLTPMADPLAVLTIKSTPTEGALTVPTTAQSIIEPSLVTSLRTRVSETFSPQPILLHAASDAATQGLSTGILALGVCLSAIAILFLVAKNASRIWQALRLKVKGGSLARSVTGEREDVETGLTHTQNGQAVVRTSDTVAPAPGLSYLSQTAPVTIARDTSASTPAPSPPQRTRSIEAAPPSPQPNQSQPPTPRATNPSQLPDHRVSVTPSLPLYRLSAGSSRPPSLPLYRPSSAPSYRSSFTPSRRSTLRSHRTPSVPSFVDVPPLLPPLPLRLRVETQLEASVLMILPSTPLADAPQKMPTSFNHNHDATQEPSSVTSSLPSHRPPSNATYTSSFRSDRTALPVYRPSSVPSFTDLPFVHIDDSTPRDSARFDASPEAIESDVTTESRDAHIAP